MQILLPLAAPDGTRLPQALFDAVRQELVDRFGGLTAYTRAPARGLWDDGGGVERDDIVVYEVMVDQLDRPWWAGYRAQLCARFRQQELVVRAHVTELL
ncbi:hypothetical protein [Ramlibacter montanisoli]|uniref:hypothetical protein n=1 Tax=Ramlibacter montanisoli TaxID=2732512 RepID=UPI001C0F334F|nr:hypothetical protein [Ramlibacter montanisoli]